MASTSGPLNTEGSFMSFHTYRCLVAPGYAPGRKLVAHHSRTWSRRSNRSSSSDEPSTSQTDEQEHCNQRCSTRHDRHTSRPCAKYTGPSNRN